MEARTEELRRDQVATVIKTIAALAPSTDAQRQVQAREGGYFTSNAERISIVEHDLHTIQADISDIKHELHRSLNHETRH